MNRRRLLAILALTPLLLSWLPVAGQDRIRAGEVHEKVICLDDPSQSYTLYLPAGYSRDTKWPILYAFDPGARGKIPVELFRVAAERYGYIVAGSNNAHNGPGEPILLAVNAVWRDTRSRFAIDEKRVYVTGFSGGARVASRLPKLSRAPIAGVIGCGAGLATGEKLEDLGGAYYCGVVGRKDFNYLEMRRLSAEMENRAILYSLIVFEGGHSWPPAEVCQRALEWMEILAMKQGLRPRDEKLLQDLFFKEVAADQALEQSGKLIDAVDSYGSVIGAFKELVNVSELEARREQLVKSDVYRCPQSLSLDCRTNGFTALDGGDAKKAALFFEIAVRAAKVMPAHLGYLYFYLASSYALDRNESEALANLAEAVKAGFDDAESLEKDLNFEFIRKTKEFQDILDILKRKQPG